MTDGLGDVGTVALGDLCAQIISLLEELPDPGDHRPIDRPIR